MAIGVCYLLQPKPVRTGRATHSDAAGQTITLATAKFGVKYAFPIFTPALDPT